MRRISLALALAGAVAAAGCGGGTSGNSGSAPGIGGQTFTVTVQNGQNGNTSLAITGGFVTSSPAGIDCGVAPHGSCSADFPVGTVVTLTANAIDGYSFWGFAGDCFVTGIVCELEGETADQYVLAQFGAAGEFPPVHPNWDPAVDVAAAPQHATQAKAYLATVPVSSTVTWPCAACHGAGVLGMGIAPSCAACHAGSVTPPTVVGAPDALAKGETCIQCHAGQGAAHQALYNRYADAPTLVAAIESVVSTANVGDVDGDGKDDTGTFKSVVTFNLTKGGVAYGDATLTGLAQKRYMGTKYDPATKKFETASAISYGSLKSLGGGRYTVQAAKAKFAPESSNSFIYFYFAEKATIVPPSGHYNLYENVASVGKVYGTVDFVSPVNVGDCERCHGAPYQKHGYRAGRVSGLPDMVACKACHHDQRVGSHPDWQVLVTDPVRYTQIATTPLTTEELAKYAYVANTMNDTHMSHAMEFAYPQSMGNCTTCHSGKLGMVLTDANFTLTTCKSCHPITATQPDAHRAPPLNPAGAIGSALPAYHTIDAAGLVGGKNCNDCHADAANFDAATSTWSMTGPLDGKGTTAYGHYVPLFKEIHTGYNKVIYANTAGTKYSDVFKVAITAASYDGATKELTFTVTATETPDLLGLAVTDIVPTVLVSMYGYDTKDFLVGAHVTHSDGKRNLEWATNAVEGAMGVCDLNGDHAVDPTEGPCPLYPRMATLSSGGGVWQIKADLGEAEPLGLIASGAVKRVEIGVIPTLHDAGGEMLALDAATRTFDLVANAFDDAFYPAIVKVQGCNACHEALGTTFHEPDRGGSVVGCRLCHTTLAGGSHLPMQSRSIDSYVHAIHSMQPFDPGDIDFSDPVQALHYEHHIESTYPNFTTLNCESCHNPGTYNIANQTKSLPGILSKNDPGMPFVVPAVTTGPSARACGGCHRAELINEGDSAGLAQFDAHTKAFGYRTTGTATTLYQVIDSLFCDLTETCTPPPPPPPAP